MNEEIDNTKKSEKNDDDKSKKKVSLLKKKNKPSVWNALYQNVDVKHVVNINDVTLL